MRCLVIRVTGSVRYIKYFYRSTLFSGPVSVCSSQVAAQPITIVSKAMRIYMPILMSIGSSAYVGFMDVSNRASAMQPNKAFYNEPVLLTIDNTAGNDCHDFGS